MLAGIGRGRWNGVVVSRRRRPVCREAIEQLEDLPESVEIQEVIWPGRGINFWRGEIIGAAQGDGGVAPVGEHDNQVGIVPSAQANDLDAMTAEGMMRMGDGDESRRRRG